MSVYVEISNYPEVSRWVDKESAKTVDAGFVIIKKTALKVMDSMKRYILPSVITGRLRASVHIEANDARLSALSRKRSSNSGSFPTEDRIFSYRAQKGEAVVGSNVIYADSVNVRGRARGYFERAISDGETFMERQLKRDTK